MKIKNFTFKSDNKDFIDELDRENIAELYVKFINTLDGHHVIGLDAPWGSGKSTLINYMCENFEKNQDAFVKYNAWENDYTKEPLISLMSDIFTEFQDKKYIGIDKMKNQISKISSIGKKGATALIKGASRILLGESGSNDAIAAVKETGKIFVEDNIDNLFKDIDESKKSRIEFKEELIKYTNQILKEKNKDKLIIIIDELDRCRPTFAIELLENIKHLFDIENIVFFIAVDSKQLAESIKEVYGNGFDADTYLHRFFDFELHLKRDSIGFYFYKNIEKHLMNNFIEVEQFAEESSIIFNLTIRDINKIINEAYILKKLFSQANQHIGGGTINFQPKIFLLLLILKYKNQDLYKYLKEAKKNLNNQDFINKFSEKTDIIRFMGTYINLEKDSENIILILEAIRRIEETI
ncbi:KAP family NTPase [Aliarcobacter faecis]|uniref:KAP family P-loop NTPase fold protein n=1 Tax=Aliarcobacter faecis TaxID=1564138 RepID=UPI0004797589|nr:P-loop NTPase fold protein [Aliarcobacter faecis]QKF72749.1 KAP family NTPase [Aliarcobacter faecis]